MTQSIDSHRKDEHVFLAEKYFADTATAGFEQVRLLHDALPETAVEAVDVTPHLFKWQWPIFINAMTGGSPQTGQTNAALGRIAAATGLAVASGSQSVALKEPALAPTFTVLRDNDPAGFVMGNIGASHGWASATQALAMLKADALEIHLNAVQEAVMPEGDRDWRWLDQIQTIVDQSAVPVIVKEVGFGMTRETITALQANGVQYIDVGGHGGTNFARIENARRPAHDLDYLAEFGQSTVESLLEASNTTATILATGGIRTPWDVIKALRLGARAVGLSGLVLHWLTQEGEDATIAHLHSWQAQLPLLVAMLGQQDLAGLRDVPVVYSQALRNYASQRQLTLP